MRFGKHIVLCQDHGVLLFVSQLLLSHLCVFLDQRVHRLPFPGLLCQWLPGGLAHWRPRRREDRGSLNACEAVCCVEPLLCEGPSVVSVSLTEFRLITVELSLIITRAGLGLGQGQAHTSRLHPFLAVWPEPPHVHL